ncbi:hypothetical protein Micbo1qcDRAFT_210258 [Microdochium bolleyi]|uniref:Uncharacterized protein n=1 Tax=Microdochium bolleyi TaxID=196109 RepID=A0A136IJG4_9PEZI|nr:hypothetical protein Micbo1qcDRAFT_210258 [Microdochium bolleyi]
MTNLYTAALVAGVMQAIICLASLGMGFASCAAVRVKDGIRSKGFRWVGTAFFIQALSAVCAAAMSGLDSYFFSRGFFSPNRLFTSFYYVAEWLAQISCAAIVFVLVQTSQSTTPTGNYNSSSTSRSRSKLPYWCNLATFVFLVLLSTIAFAGLEGYLARRPFDPVNGVSVNPPFEKLAGAVDIMLLIASTVALALCVRASVVAKKDRTQRTKNILVVAGAAVLWVQTVWTVVESVPMNIQTRPAVSRMDDDYVAQGVGFYYLNFIVLVLLYVAGRKSANGLYSDGGAGGSSPTTKPLTTAAARTQLQRDEEEQEFNTGYRSAHQHSPQQQQQQYPAEMPEKGEEKGPVEMEHTGHYYGTRNTPLAAAELPSPVIGNGSLRPWPLPDYDEQKIPSAELMGQQPPTARHELMGSLPPVAARVNS